MTHNELLKLKQQMLDRAEQLHQASQVDKDSPFKSSMCYEWRSIAYKECAEMLQIFMDGRTDVGAQYAAMVRQRGEEEYNREVELHNRGINDD